MKDIMRLPKSEIERLQKCVKELQPKSSHTPGPWLTNAHVSLAPSITDNNVERVAVTWPRMDREEQRANGFLIAAAPALLQSLTDCLDELKAFMEGESCDHTVGICYCGTFRRMDEASEVLKLAKGEATTPHPSQPEGEAEV